MVEALGETVTPVVSVLGGQDVAITAEALSPDTKLILEVCNFVFSREKKIISICYIAFFGDFFFH